MKRNIILSAILSVVVFASCEKVFMHPEPKSDNLSIYDEYIKIVKEKYALFDVKGIDIDLMADTIRTYITNDLTEDELFNALGFIASSLKEGHTALEKENPNAWAGYYAYEGYPAATSSNLKHYYDKEFNPTSTYIGNTPYDSFKLKYGKLTQDPDIGFIRMFTFDLELTDEEIETMMEYLSDTKGLIIDVRINLGGLSYQATKLASYFTDKEIEIGTNYVKNGPGRDDFATSKLTLSPSNSPYTYTKPIMLLYDRVTFSSGSLFSIMLYTMDHVTTLGQEFGGGTGEIIYGYLSNGWKYSLSTSNLVDSYGRPTDNGIVPDIPLLVDLNDTINDAVIDRAILELQ